MDIKFIITMITIIGGVLGIIKTVIDNNNRIAKLEVEMRKEMAKMQVDLTNKMAKMQTSIDNNINELKIEIIKLQHQFGIVENKQVDNEIKINEVKTEINEVKTLVNEVKIENNIVKTETNEHINKVEVDNKNFIKELFQSFENWMQRPAIHQNPQINEK